MLYLIYVEALFVHGSLPGTMVAESNIELTCLQFDVSYVKFEYTETVHFVGHFKGQLSASIVNSGLDNIKEYHYVFEIKFSSLKITTLKLISINDVN